MRTGASQKLPWTSLMHTQSCTPAAEVSGDPTEQRLVILGRSLEAMLDGADAHAVVRREPTILKSKGIVDKQ